MVAPYLRLESSKKGTLSVKAPESLINSMNILNIIIFVNTFQESIPNANNAYITEKIIVAICSLK